MKKKMRKNKIKREKILETKENDQKITKKNTIITKIQQYDTSIPQYSAIVTSV